MDVPRAHRALEATRAVGGWGRKRDMAPTGRVDMALVAGEVTVMEDMGSEVARWAKDGVERLADLGEVRKEWIGTALVATAQADEEARVKAVAAGKVVGMMGEGVEERKDEMAGCWTVSVGGMQAERRADAGVPEVPQAEATAAEATAQEARATEVLWA